MICLNLTLKAKAAKAKINMWEGLHQTTKLLHDKGDHQLDEKLTYWTGENSRESYT